MEEFKTCRLVYPVSQVTEEEVRNFVADKTNGEGVLYNFYPESKVGANKRTVAIADIPYKYLINFHENENFKLDTLPGLKFSSEKGMCCDNKSVKGKKG